MCMLVADIARESTSRALERVVKELGLFQIGRAPLNLTTLFQCGVSVRISDILGSEFAFEFVIDYQSLFHHISMHNNIRVECYKCIHKLCIRLQLIKAISIIYDVLKTNLCHII